jgi:hypothetical protein
LPSRDGLDSLQTEVDVHMIGEIAALFALFVAVAAFGIAAFRLTLHVMQINPEELARWWRLFRTKPDLDLE